MWLKQISRFSPLCASFHQLKSRRRPLRCFAFNVITSVGIPFSPTWSRREGEREGEGGVGGRDGGREGGREGGRKGGRGVLSQWKEGPLSVFQQFVFKLDIYSMNTCIIYNTKHVIASYVHHTCNKDT